MEELITKTIEYGARALDIDELVELRFGDFDQNTNIQNIINNAIDREFAQRDKLIAILKAENTKLKEKLKNETI